MAMILQEWFSSGIFSGGEPAIGPLEKKGRRARISRLTLTLAESCLQQKPEPLVFISQ
jgi:hypothetical protein